MKKLFAILLALVMCVGALLSFAACGLKKDKYDNDYAKYCGELSSYENLGKMEILQTEPNFSLSDFNSGKAPNANFYRFYSPAQGASKSGIGGSVVKNAYNFNRTEDESLELTKLIVNGDVNLNVNRSNELNNTVVISIDSYEYKSDPVYNTEGTAISSWKDGMYVYGKTVETEDGYSGGAAIVSFSFDLNTYITNGQFTANDITETKWYDDMLVIVDDYKGYEATTYTERHADWKDDVQNEAVILLNEFMTEIDKIVQEKIAE